MHGSCCIRWTLQSSFQCASAQPMIRSSSDKMGEHESTPAKVASDITSRQASPPIREGGTFVEKSELKCRDFITLKKIPCSQLKALFKK